jgi:tetratricopeptide (TPR) repeat protein
VKIWHSTLALILLLVLGVPAISNADPAPAELLSRGQVNDAIVALSNRNDSESLNQLSRAYYAIERWEEAVRFGERAVAMRPQEASYHLWLAREYGRKAAQSNPLVAANLARRAKSEFERAVELDPTNVQARADLSRYYIEAPAIMGGGLDKAREQALEVEKFDPVTSQLILARAAAKEKRFADAEAHFQQAIRSASHPADCWMQLAEFYRNRGRFPEMERAVSAAAALSDKPAVTYFDAATQLYLGDRNFSDAAQYLQKYLASGELVESAPAFRAHYLLGQIYEKTGRRGDAALEYRASLSLASGFEPASRALGKLR